MNSTVLAFDYGNCRIGVAAGQNVTGSAQGIATLTTGGVQGPWPAIEQLISEWAPAALVVGLPLAFNGRETPLSLAARAFGKELLERFGLPVTFIDETLTSV
ncbi:MAG TPA: Holliday junction resolvase RuvX, partial [Arenicellales bacterium]|nr:Holliday junction resolvase RuvX [Arenicellales bacterium]